MDKAEPDEYLLTNMPHFVAIKYHQLLNTREPQEQVRLIVQIYDLTLRTLTVSLISQYISQFIPPERVNIYEPSLHRKLREFFDGSAINEWEEIFFFALDAYRGKREFIFMPDLYDLYWDDSRTPPRRRQDEIEPLFRRLTEAALKLSQKSREDQLLPQDESGWKVLAAELLELLRRFLASLQFVGEYDLIRVLDQDKEFYNFELHKGLQVSQVRLPLPRTPLMSDQFYLRKGTEDFLLLHPLFVFWGGEGDKYEASPMDIGIYYRFLDKQLEYLLTIPFYTSTGDKYLVDFMALIYDVLIEVKQKLGEAKKLTWLQLREICSAITSKRTQTVKRKYDKEAYLRRNEVRQKFERFLNDPRTSCFVLVGKSGVGKSSFLLAMEEEFQRSDNEMCFLIYDAIYISTKLSITDFITQHFNESSLLDGYKIQNVWEEIDRIDGRGERLVVLCVDALNENHRPEELLQQLNELAQRGLPWLKIVLTSRPETWWRIKREVGGLAQGLYYQESEDKMFSYSALMDPFSREELSEVYGKYQRVYKLQTPYEALSHKLRELLRDPFNLWLLTDVAKQNPEKVMPERVKVSELVDLYLNNKDERTELPRKDLDFLEKELMPLMIKEEHYSNVITATELSNAGNGLYETVYSERELSDKHPVNQSFQRLADADILVRYDKRAIAFKHERFYEYFAGDRVASLSRSHKDRYGFYLKLIGRTKSDYFLWGVVRNALTEEAKQPDLSTVLRLCFTDQRQIEEQFTGMLEEQRVKEMMVDVLTTVGLDDPARTENILWDLLPQKKGTRIDTRSLNARRNAGRIAAEVGANLSMARLLQAAALQKDEAIRTSAVRHAYYLWKRDHEVGFQILRHIAEKTTSGLIPDLKLFEAPLGLSLIIFFENYQDGLTLETLQGVCREVIAHILRIRENESGWKKVVRSFLRERTLAFIINFVFLLLDKFPAYGGAVNYPALEAFFHLETPEKALYSRLVQYIDVEGSYSREQMENDFLEVIKMTNNYLIVFILQFGLIAHTCYTPHEFLPFLKKFFEEAQKDVESYPYMNDVVHVMDNVLHRGPMDDELFDFFVSCVETCQEYYIRYPQAIRNDYTAAPEALNLGPYTFHYYRKTGTARTEWLKTRMQRALSRNDTTFFRFLLTSEMPLIGIERQNPQAAFDALELLLQLFKDGEKERDEEKSENEGKIRSMIRSFLASLKVYYPGDVDQFLEEPYVSDEDRLAVRTSESAETIGALIGQRSLYFVRDTILVESPSLRSYLMHILAEAVNYKSLRDWLDYFLREVINVIYGEEALRPSKKRRQPLE
jgi:hypothetical protein